MEPFLSDGYEQVHRVRDPELRLHRVLGGAGEALDSQMLLDPLEKQLHLPALPIQRADGQRWQAEVVGQKHQSLAGLVFETDAPQMFRVTVAAVKAVERDGLIAEHTGIALGRRRVEPSGIEIRLCPDDEEGSRLVQGIEALEVGVPPVHHIEGSGLGDQKVEHIDLVQFAVRNVDNARNTAPQIEQRVQPDRRLGRTEVCPVKYRQAQIDRGGIQRVERLRREAPLDVAQALAVGQLGEGHAAQLLAARQRAYAVIAAVTGHNTVTALLRQEVHDLREQCLANAHASLRSSQGCKAGRTGQRHASLRQFAISRNSCRYRGYETSGRS